MPIRKKILLLAASTLTLSILAGYRSSSAQPPQKLITHIAELEIDAAHLDAYKAALTEEIDASIRLEPGVLTLYAVALKENPTQIRVFETYASADAYQSHLQTPHFLKYKAPEVPDDPQGELNWKR